ncbi:heterokaryon incompatibility protein, partial [Thozetella sp. PMI_491]
SWHDPSCSRFDPYQFDGVTSCLSCGSIEGIPEPLAPVENEPAHPPLRQRNEYRILDLDPGDFKEPISCRLIVVDMAKPSTYEAISYTWSDEDGDTTKSQTIRVNSKAFSITQNCHNALKRARMRWTARRVWIDAICIDQDNIDERGHQVSLMPQIYSRAAAVLIYIGEEQHDSSWVLRELASHMDLDNGKSQSWAIRSPKRKDALELLLSRRYFRRVWVLQEVALARKAQTIELPPVLFFDYKTYTRPDQLLRLLDLASNCEAGDLRDKVYALCGLLSQGEREVIQPDYRLSVREVYTKTAIHLISTVGTRPVFIRA